jgi:hypothetical protein
MALSPSARRRLKSLGLSPRAIEQIARGDMVHDARDRRFVAWLLADGGAVRRRGAVPRVGWEVMVRALKVLKARGDGMSDLGIRQLSTGNIVTDPEDRWLTAALLDATAAGSGAPRPPRTAARPESGCRPRGRSSGSCPRWPSSG